LYLTFFGAIWLFLRIDLAFFSYDYLATLVYMSGSQSRVADASVNMYCAG